MKRNKYVDIPLLAAAAAVDSLHNSDSAEVDNRYSFVEGGSRLVGRRRNPWLVRNSDSVGVDNLYSFVGVDSRGLECLRNMQRRVVAGDRLALTNQIAGSRLREEDKRSSGRIEAEVETLFMLECRVEREREREDTG
jgi:hypothetical protein